MNKNINSKIKKVDQLIENKFVGLYDITYKNKKNEDKHWTVASRKKMDQLNKMYLENEEDKIDAVVIVATHEESKELVLVNQYRVPINGYIYELPAGLVESNEEMFTAVRRELKEETGLDLVEIDYEKSHDKVYLSPGMTDESVAFVYCTCRGELSTEYLEDDEDITPILASKEKAKEILNGDDKIDIKALLTMLNYVNN